jgi:hypothetical protein
MVIIAFAPKSSKFLPNVFCKKFKHCAVIVPETSGFTMYQFITTKNIAKIPITARDIKILGIHGWRFVYIPCELHRPFPPRKLTCVNMAKYAIRLHAPFVLTPDALYKTIKD